VTLALSLEASNRTRPSIGQSSHGHVEPLAATDFKSLDKLASLGIVRLSGVLACNGALHRPDNPSLRAGCRLRRLRDG
jgi:hypothetical protein